MTFSIVAMVCVAGMTHADCGPEPGFSRDKVIVGEAKNEIECGILAQQAMARVSVLKDLAEGEFIKVMCVRNG
jgi:hypothetical protein